MSFKAFVWAWDQDVPNPDFHHVLLALANIAPLREVKASIPYIAGVVRRSPRKVRAALDWLTMADIITVTERPGRCDIIRLNVPKDFTVTMEDDGDLEAGTRGRPRKTPAPLTEKPLSNPCTRGADESKEPSGEPRLATDVALPAEPADRSEARRAFEAWNGFAVAHDKACALKLTDQRRKALNARIREVGGLDGFLRALASVEGSRFLMGRTQAGFMISLDFILQPSSFTKLIEGFYHRDLSAGPTDAPRNGHDPHGLRNSAMFAGARAAVDRHQRERGWSSGS
jgi:hypothetical protein